MSLLAHPIRGPELRALHELRDETRPHPSVNLLRVDLDEFVEKIPQPRYRTPIPTRPHCRATRRRVQSPMHCIVYRARCFIDRML